MAVLPTPGSPISTGLFLVRRESTCIDAADLLVAADDRIELALARELGEVAAVLLERLVLRLGVLIGDARAAAHRLQRLQHRVARDAGCSQRAARRVAIARRRGRSAGAPSRRTRPGARRRLEGGVASAFESDSEMRGWRAARDLRQRGEGPVELRAERVEDDAELLEHRNGRALGLREQRAQQMRPARSPPWPRPAASDCAWRERFLTLDGELVESHARNTLSTRRSGASPFRRL